MQNQNIASLEYDPAGREITRTLGNGLVTNMTYRHDHLLASINNPAVGNYTYTYDTNKNPTSETIVGNMSSYGWTNTFDDQDRLINWQRADALKSQAWDLSPVGNWNTLTSTSPLLPGEGQGEGGTVTKNFTHGLAHELTSVNGVAITHDAKGNLTQDSRGLQLAWDMDNKLKAAQVPAATTWGTPGYHTYEYDGIGRRVAKLVNDGNNLEITLYICNDQQVLAEYTGSNFSNLTLARTYAYGTYIDEPLTMVDSTAAGILPAGTPETLYYHRNRQYSVTAMSDSSGQVVERYTYTPHGAATIFDGAGISIPASNLQNEITFTGRQLDPETGLIYLRARMYDTRNGNFISRDPLHYVDGASVYLGYFATGGVDPIGLDSVTLKLEPEKPDNTPFSLKDLSFLATPGRKVLGNTFRSIDISCICGDCKDKAGNCGYKVTECTIAIKQHIVIDDNAVKSAGRKVEGTYGHEQLHVQNTITFAHNLKKEVEKMIENETCHVPEKPGNTYLEIAKLRCELSKEELKTKINEKDSDDAKFESNHGHDKPKKGTDYDPIGKMPIQTDIPDWVDKQIKGRTKRK